MMDNDIPSKASVFLRGEKPFQNRAVGDCDYSNLYVIVCAMLYNDVENKPDILRRKVQTLINERHDAFFSLLTFIDPDIPNELIEVFDDSRALSINREQYVNRISTGLGQACGISHNHIRLSLYAIATLLQLDLFVLETHCGDFVWSYIPVLLKRSEDHELLHFKNDIKEIRRGFMTFLMTDFNNEMKYYTICSNDRDVPAPRAYGLVGVSARHLNTASRHPNPRKVEVLRNLENNFIELLGYIEAFQATPLELQERRKRMNTAVIATSATGIVGGVLAIVGIALTPVTFGASLGLTIAGAGVGLGSGGIQAGFRIHEAVKQNAAVKLIKENVDKIQMLSTSISYNINNFNRLFQTNEDDSVLQKVTDNPGISLKGFMTIGNVLRSIHTTAAIAVSALRVGASGAAVAASIIGPVSMIVDIAFLAEAAHNKAKGDYTNAGKMIECIMIPNILLITMFIGNQKKRFVDKLDE